MSSLTAMSRAFRTLAAPQKISFSIARGNSFAFPSHSIINYAPCRSISDSLKAQIDQAVKDNPVVVFMKGNKESPQCGFSRAVVQILEIQGVTNFKTVNVLSDSEIRDGIKEYTSWPTIPQVFVKGEFVGGCDILMNMHRSGDLEQLLVQQGIIKESKDS
ncbi:hypothetical protein BASA61_001660 [Batrachochytrium salamandrivorans]|nr:hypothetical protein BASA62_004408 [Batrachochytrium salamandrivorans]KAH6573844.1 hypothetical protein BASA60_005864 [Batrachochytrium salamandrivorans]KAH6601860.1 hypothetical protein BASA61_001660 [Batrachochytrium salamandrivorans]KAH9268975.1 Grx4 family monothiol glutaredoxin [Batrachochytrium salamandrivorans]